jgi:hypothetical protein
MRSTFAISTIVLVGLIAVPGAVRAQQQMGGASRTSSSMFGGSMGGGSSMGASGGMSRAGGLGSGGFGSTGGGLGSSGGFGSSTGSGGFGQTTMGSSNQFGQTGNFIGANTNPNNFIGGNLAAGANNMNQRIGTAGMQGLGGMMSPYGTSQLGQRPGGNMNGMMGGGARMPGAQGQMNAPSIRTNLSLGFEAPAPDPQKLSSSLGQRLASLPAVHWNTPGQVEVQGRTAILRGVVATQHDRDLAERVIRLEAGIEQVQNQLVVASDSASPTKSPAASSETPAATP